MIDIPLKQTLLAACGRYVAQRIETARRAMEAAQTSANEESKSSAGDKYETGRAMAQIERDRHARQLAEAQQLQAELSRMSADITSDVVRVGSVVETTAGWFFIAISAGKITHDGQDYVAVSAASPVGRALLGLRAGDTYQVAGRSGRVLRIT